MKKRTLLFVLILMLCLILLPTAVRADQRGSVLLGFEFDDSLGHVSYHKTYVDGTGSTSVTIKQNGQFNRPEIGDVMTIQAGRKNSSVECRGIRLLDYWDRSKVFMQTSSDSITFKVPDIDLAVVVDLVGPPPVITSHPADRTALTGQEVTMQVEATGLGNTYCWYGRLSVYR